MNVRRFIRCTRLRLRFRALRRSGACEFRSFVCNICGKPVSAPVGHLINREAPSCYHCYSSKRFRSLMAALSQQLHGAVIPLPQFPKQKHVSGLGMSDSKVYAQPLARIFAYTNTFYHKRPRLDITAVAPELTGSVDFVISSDVFEHVPPPVERAFTNLNRILKPGGFCILSVPYTGQGETREHFPELHDFKIVYAKGKPRLLNRTRDGRNQVFDTLCFHGGGGATLEMRLFSRQSLLESLRAAGFTNVEFCTSDIPEYGIFMGDDLASLPIVIRKPA